MAKTTSARRGVSNTPAKKHAAVAKKPATTKQKRSGTASGTRALAQEISARRPDSGDSANIESIERFAQTLIILKTNLENYAAHMRALDRSRLNGVGVKKQGFIEVAYNSAEINPEFLPHWITPAKFERDFDLLTAVQNLLDLNKQISELIWNIVMNSADMAYTDALEYYAIVREAAKRRVDPAEAIFERMSGFFKSRGDGKRNEDQPTEAEIKRDINSLLHGRKDGKVVVENISPKIEKGEKKLIDKTYKSKIAYKNINEGEETL